MDLSVLIVTHHSGREIEKCLRSVKKYLDRENLQYEICVVDNASPDETIGIIRSNFPEVKLICEDRNLGFSAGINRALGATSAPFVLWLNPDTEIMEGGFRAVLEKFRTHPRLGIAGLKIMDPGGTVQLSCRSFPSYETALFNRYSILTRLFPGNPVSERYLNSRWDHSTEREVDWVSGACLMHRREAAEKIGGLDEKFFMYCEDVDFCYRARKAGWQVWYLPQVVVQHAIGASARRRPQAMILEHHRSMWHYYKKHFPRNLLKDAVVLCGIFLRCLAAMAGAASQKGGGKFE